MEINAPYLNPVRTDNYVLVIDNDEILYNGGRICTLINLTTREERAQTLYPQDLPSGKNPKWQETVAKRIARTPEADLVPYFLLKGIK